MAWALRTDERPNPNENEEPGHDYAVFVHSNKKKRSRALPERRLEMLLQRDKSMVEQVEQLQEQEHTSYIKKKILQSMCHPDRQRQLKAGLDTAQ
jgi:hypothetical protein